jgi:diguanylate cyclase (GGDEF)-like protein
MDVVPVGVFATNVLRRVTRFNSYLVDQFGWQTDEAGLLDFEANMTKASQLFCDSYVYPLLLEIGEVEEAQLTFFGKGGKRIPVVVNATRTADGGAIWGVSSARNRDKLFEELVASRTLLEEQTKQLRVLASTDELTGVLNRRALNQTAEKVFAQADRDGSSVSIALLDIDDFKRVNDTYGHSIGDDILREIGRALSEVCRINEIVARFGGEEFIVVMAGADSDEALVLCDRIHDRVANVMKYVCPVTVSIGVATRLGKYRSSFDDLLKQADDALYSAKADGKNRTAVCGNIRLSPIIQQTRQPDLNMLAVSNHK